MSDLDPTWFPDRHLDAVYRRGRQLRRRRRAVLAAIPTAALALVGAVVVGGSLAPTSSVVHAAERGPQGVPSTGAGAAGADGDASSSTARTTSGSQAAHAGGWSGASGSLSPSGATPNSPTGAATGNGQTGTGGSASSPGSGQSPQSTPAPRGPSSASPTAATASSACTSSDLDYSTITDHSTYGAGQAVTISLVVHNHSGRPCDAPGPCGIGPWATVQNAAGTVVWQSHPIAVACTNPPPGPPHLAPGQSATYGAGTWDQEVCTSSGCSGQAPAGTYRAVAHRGNVTAKGIRFSVN